MEYQQINDKTIKISLTFEDLKAHDVKMSDFLVNQGMVEKLFYELVSELEIEDKFANTGMMTFQVRPHPQGVDLLVTEEVNMENMQFPEGSEGLQEMMDDVEESELFQFQDNFYLTILDNQKRKGFKEVSLLRARMLEYGEPSDFS